MGVHPGTMVKGSPAPSAVMYTLVNHYSQECHDLGISQIVWLPLGLLDTEKGTLDDLRLYSLRTK
jgi:hypothetical protein